MDLPANQLLYLEQGKGVLEDHTWDFIHLVCLTHYPYCPLCVFYHTSLRRRSKAHLSVDGPKEDSAAFVEWVLENNNSPFTISPAEDDFTTSPTPSPPETYHPPPANDATWLLLVPTIDRKDRSSAIDEPKLRNRLEGVITPEPASHYLSDQVQEPATPQIMRKG